MALLGALRKEKFKLTNMKVGHKKCPSGLDDHLMCRVSQNPDPSKSHRA